MPFNLTWLNAHELPGRQTHSSTVKAQLPPIQTHQTQSRQICHQGTATRYNQIAVSGVGKQGAFPFPYDDAVNEREKPPLKSTRHLTGRTRVVQDLAKIKNHPPSRIVAEPIPGLDYMSRYP
jgi:hypothetical protein